MVSNIPVEMAELRLLVPATMHKPGQVFIAGGYAASPEKARDIDLWLQIEQSEDFVTHFHTVASRLRGFRGYRPASLMEAAEYHDSLRTRDIYRLGSITHEATEREIQVFGFGHETIHEMLDEFDISTHQVAIDLMTGERISLPTTTLPDRLPRVTDWSTPFTTLTRLQRLLARYGFVTQDHPDLAQLLDLTGEKAA